MPKKKNTLEKIQSIPNTEALEHANASSKIILSLIPVVGSTLSEIINISVGVVVRKRLEQWQEAVVKGIEKLYQQFEDLPKNMVEDDRFVTALLTATQLAARTHQREKLEALRNAVLNSALPSAPEDDLQLMFLSFVDTLTVAHIRLLALLNNPPLWVKQNKLTESDWGIGFPWAAITNVTPSDKIQEKENNEFYERLLKDLEERGYKK